jgi:inner membrane transporter RhtA
VVALGVILGVMNLAFYEALDRIPLGIAVTLEFVGPLTVAVLGSRRRRDLLWVALAAAGLILLAPVPGSDLDALGCAFALFAGGCWGLYILVTARVGRALPGGSGLALAMAIAAVVTMPFGLVDGGTELLDGELLVIAFGVAILSSAIPYSLELEALRRLPESVFGVLMSVEPAVAATAGFVVLGQDLEARELVAIGLVLAASAGALSAADRVAPEA